MKKSTENNQITLNSLQHFLFCKRQWAIICICGEWDGNQFTAKGDILHERVHDAQCDEKRSAKYSVRGMPLFCDRLNLNGVADLVEFLPDGKGVFISTYGKKCLPVAVEYKAGKPNIPGTVNEYDAIQTVGQILCLEAMFGCNAEGYVYYGKINRRVKVTNVAEYKDKCAQIIDEMKAISNDLSMPSAEYAQRCKSCSVNHICLPKLIGKSYMKEIASQWKEAGI